MQVGSNSNAMDEESAAEDTFLPTQYPELKTPVLTDLVISGLIFCFCILALSFYVAFPGIRGKEKFHVYVRFTISILIGSFILVSNFGQSWEVAEVITHTQYKAVEKRHINAHIGVYVGLRSINVTLTGKPVKQVEETIDYNERFFWKWAQGRRGFGSRAGRFNREFRASQLKGLPYPILWIAEYFTFDGEGIRFGRHYRLAGWYAHIMIWTAFPLWLLSNIMFFMVIQYGAVALLLTGTFLLSANVIFSSIRNPIPLQIPFEDGTLTFHYGWSFWMVLFTGIACVILGIIIFFADLRFPDHTATFFGISVLQEYEDFYADPAEFSTQKDLHRAEIYKIPKIEDPDPESNLTENKAVYGMRRRTMSIRFQKGGCKKPVTVPRRRVLFQEAVGETDDQPVYENLAIPRFDPIGEEDDAGSDPIRMKDF